jgi:hypothetical protein
MVTKRYYHAVLMLFTTAIILSLAGCSNSSDNDNKSSTLSYEWTRLDSGTTESLTCVYAIDDSNVWAVGRHGTILFYDGSSWQKDPQSGIVTTNDLYAITAVDKNHVWVSGDSALILFNNGSSWTVQPTGGGPEQDIWTISAVSTDEVWAGCQAGWYLIYDGSDWTPYQSNTGTNFTGLKAFGNGETWALGNDINEYGNLLLNIGNGWTGKIISYNWLTKIDGTDNNNLWAVGKEGSLFHIHSGRIDKIETGSTAEFRGVCVLSSSDVWAAGRTEESVGELLHYNGETCEKMVLPPTESLWSVSSYNGSVVWAVGDDGTILRGVLTSN